jgi:thiamine biosynthesis lipoprotein
VKPLRSSVNRRALLRGLGPARHAPAATLAPPKAATGTDLLRAARPAMGSFFEIALPAAVPGALALAEQALDLIERLEAQMTIYRDDSELSRLNAHAHEGPMPVEPGLFALLERAVAIGRATDGAYDVASGALSIAWGFVRGPRRVPDAATLEEARARSGVAHVRLDPAARTVAFDTQGVVLNLGAIGKGHAVDRAIEVARRHWFPTPALVQAGQSSVYALGSPPDRFGGRWPIALRNPFDPEHPLGTLWLRNRALGVSGTAFQKFEAAGRVYGHILDPRTGEPAASGPALVAVLAPTAAEADALSTAFYLLGPAGAARYAAEHRRVAAIFVDVARAGSNEPALTLVGVGPDDFDHDPRLTVRRAPAPAA